jgi:hypothetical protein
VFDADFFLGKDFHGRVQEFLREHPDGSLRVEVVTATGERIDTLRLQAVESGARLHTRDERLVFLPYVQIAYIDVSSLQDFRIPGFELAASTGSAHESPIETRLVASNGSA